MWNLWEQTSQGKELLALRKQQDQLEQKVKYWQQPVIFSRECQEYPLNGDSLKDELGYLLNLRTKIDELGQAVANKKGPFSQKKDLQRENNQFRERLEAHSNKLYDVAEHTFKIMAPNKITAPNQAKRLIGDAAIKANIVDLQHPLINQSDSALQRVNSKLKQPRTPDLDKAFLIDELRGIRDRLENFFLSEERFKGTGFLRFQQAAFQTAFNQKTEAFNKAIGTLTKKAGLNMADLLEPSRMFGVHTTGRLTRIEQDLNKELLDWEKAERSPHSSSKLDSRSFETALSRLNEAMNTLETLLRTQGHGNRSDDAVDRHLRVQQGQLKTQFEHLDEKLIELATGTKRIDVHGILENTKSTQPPGYGQSALSSGQVPPAAQALDQFNRRPQEESRPHQEESSNLRIR